MHALRVQENGTEEKQAQDQEACAHPGTIARLDANRSGILRLKRCDKVLSVLTAFGICGFLLAVWLAFTSNVPYGREPGGVTVEIILTISVTLIAGGLIAMIAHLNLSSRPTADEKTEWRHRLWFGGPVTAAAYILDSCRATAEAA